MSNRSNFEDFIREPEKFGHEMGERFGSDSIVFPEDPKPNKPVTKPKIEDKIVFPAGRSKRDVQAGKDR
ncbi:hypothetical protein QE152_g15755 [Popillia japonica]|uniref:Uncharacterized protein n=1 Tax=Popillia japonica TaxID=7064 RepID=A0AAW1L7G4_POPJA